MALPFEYLGAGLLKMRAKSTLGKVSMVAYVRACDVMGGR